jgi:hypothetical protein
MTAPEMDPQRVEEDRITRALERIPTVEVPGDFAARLMTRLPEGKAAGLPAGWLARRTHYGRNVLLTGAVLLCALLVMAAVASNGATAWWLMEWTALGLLAALGLWWGLAWRVRGLI